MIEYLRIANNIICDSALVHSIGMVSDLVPEKNSAAKARLIMNYNSGS